MQDITEQQELAQEISDAISKPVGFGEEFDEVGDAFQIFDFLHLLGFFVVFSKCSVWFWTAFKQVAVHLLVPDLFWDLL